jgi:hypothetical protein
MKGFFTQPVFGQTVHIGRPRREKRNQVVSTAFGPLNTLFNSADKPAMVSIRLKAIGRI